MVKLNIKKAREGIRVFEESISKNISTEKVADLKGEIATILAYSFIVFLSALFVYFYFHGSFLSKWYIILLSFMGAGCLYYLLIDFIQVLKNFKNKGD